jgi:probable HAF family extracellular repeat protein
MKEFHMKTIAAKLFVSVLFGLLLSSALFATDYGYTKIDVPNAIRTIARGINARGDIIGDYVDADGVDHDFLLHKGVFSNIDYPGRAGAARAINARGDIAGVLDDADGAHGFLLSNGKLTKIDYPGASATRAFGINNSGDITGQYTTKFGVVFGFILKDGAFHKISVSASDATSAYGAEDNGRVIVGDAVVSADSSTRGFVQHKPGDVQLLDPPGTIFPCSHARGINERGDVAGAFKIANTPDECTRPNHGFVFRQDAYDIIDPAGSLDTFVFGINDDGVVVGVFTDKNGNLHGFKATPKPTAN